MMHFFKAHKISPPIESTAPQVLREMSYHPEGMPTTTSLHWSCTLNWIECWYSWTSAPFDTYSLVPPPWVDDATTTKCSICKS